MTDNGGRVAVADVLCEFFEVAIHMILFVRGIYPPELFESTQKYGCPVKTARHPALLTYIQQIVRSIRVELQKETIHKICVVTLDPMGQAMERFVFEASMLRAFDESILQSISSFSGNEVPSNDHGSHRRVDKGKDRAIEDTLDTHQYSNTKESEHGRKGYQGVGSSSHNDHIQGDYERDTADDEEPLHRMTARERLDRQRQQQQHQQQHDIRPQHNSEGPKLGGMITLTTDVEWMLKAMLLKISVCDSYLKPLIQDCSFTVMFEMKAGAGPDAKPDFPWSPVSTAVPSERSKLPTSAVYPSPSRKIIPVKTIDIADIQLELYIEQLDR